MVHKNIIVLLTWLCLLTLSDAEESEWVPLMTPVIQRRFGSNGNRNNYIDSKNTADLHSSDNFAFGTTVKYQNGPHNFRPVGERTYNYGANISGFKTTYGSNSAGANNEQNGYENHHPNLNSAVNHPQQARYSMSTNMNANSVGMNNNGYQVGHHTRLNAALPNDSKQGRFTGLINNANGPTNNFGGSSISYGAGGGARLNVGTHFKGETGYDSPAVTSFRGTSEIGPGSADSISNYANRRPISYEQNIINTLFDQNKNRDYVANGKNNMFVGSAGLTYNQNYNRDSVNENNNNNNNNNGFVKGNDYHNNAGVNYGNVNSQAENNNPSFGVAVSNNKAQIVTEYEVGGNINNNENNNNYNNNAHRHASPNDNVNMQPRGAFHNDVKNTYAVNDNYIDGPPLSKPNNVPTQVYQHHDQHQEILPLVLPYPSIKNQPLLQNLPHSPELKPFQSNPGPPLPSPPIIQSTQSPPINLAHLPQMIQNNPMKFTPEILPFSPVVKSHPLHTLWQQQQHNHIFIQENLKDPNAINDSFFQHMIKVITNTLFYGDFEFKKRMQRSISLPARNLILGST